MVMVVMVSDFVGRREEGGRWGEGTAHEDIGDEHAMELPLL